jgi:hypothetical protein
MLYGYLPQANVNEVLYPPKILHPKGYIPIGGHVIGILAVDGLRNPVVPGVVHNASTWNFPVLYEVVEETANWKVLNAEAEGDQFSPRVRDALIEGARRLESRGVRAISGGCGFLINFQKGVAGAVDIPVFLSSLSQLTLIRQGLKPGQKIGIITAASDLLDAKAFEQIDVFDLSDLVIIGCEDCGEFAKIRGTTQAGHVNPFKVEQDLAKLAKEFVNTNPEISALLIECSSLPPYSWAIQNATNRPVFDYYTLIQWMYSAVVRYPFGGIY